MNPIARAICVAALMLGFTHICAAADGSAAHAKLLIHYPNFIRCYEDGRVEFLDWKPLPGYSGFGRRGETFVACNGQLSPEQLARLVAAVDEYLTHPAPFVYANFSVSDMSIIVIDVRHGQKIRPTCRRYTPDPDALKDLLRTISEPLASAKIESGDTNRRDEILARFNLQEPSSEERLMRVTRGLISVPNDDPEKLVEQLFDTKESGRQRNGLYDCIGILASLEGTALGDKIYNCIQTHRDQLSVGAQEEMLERAMRGGSVKPIPEFPKILHNFMTQIGTIERYPDVLQDRLEQVFTAEDLTKLASRIGVDKVTPARSLKAWDWLAANTNQLTFDQTTHRFHIADAK